MPIVSNGIQNSTDSPSSSVASSQPKAYRTGNTTVMLREGQTLKGVVSDVHSDQITLVMEDGTAFTGRLPDAGQYSIGQKAAFKIVSLDQNTIVYESSQHFLFIRYGRYHRPGTGRSRSAKVCPQQRCGPQSFDEPAVHQP
ncbi:MAG: hypothetical protein ACLSG9_00800 [Eubacterium sp.]